MDKTLESVCTELRNTIRDTGAEVRALLNDETFKGLQAFEGQHREMKANIMLSFRHLEDARMRLGKVMQQIQGGVSIFDRQEQGRASEVEDGCAMGPGDETTPEEAE